MRKYLLSLLTVTVSLSLFSQAPSGYYDAIDGKNKEELKTALHTIIRQHVSLGYATFTAQFWGDYYYKKTDWNPGGYYWDMYSNTQRTTYSVLEMSREHCMPRSWWAIDAGSSKDYGDANNDILNLYPADYDANSRKSNNPLGIVGIEDFNNGVVKVGQNTYPGGDIRKVFEPADEYKGDFARTYFYMVTCYEDYYDRWNGDGLSMLNNETYPVFKDWAINMLLEWNENDPVDQKEIDRNNTIFSMQYNRNPFIDHPELTDYIWGDKTNQNYTVTDKATSPALLTPTSQSELNFSTKENITRNILVKGVLLTQPVNIQLATGDVTQFTVNKTTISAQEAVNGYELEVTYKPNEHKTHTATLRLSSTEFGSVDMTLTGTSLATPEPVDPITPSDDMDVMIFYKGPWDMSNLPAGVTTSGTVSPYASGDLGLRANNAAVMVQFSEEPDFLQFALKPYNSWDGVNSTVSVFESTNGSAWGSSIAQYGSTDVTTGYFNTPEIYLSSSTRAIKIQYNKDKQNVGINNIIITRAAGSSINNVTDNNVRLFVMNGELHIVGASDGTILQVYNMLGKTIYQGISKNSEEEIISLGNQTGIFIVRVGNKVFKVMN
ncbi:MAG: endonuclease [Dysgonomonas sp.]